MKISEIKNGYIVDPHGLGHYSEYCSTIEEVLEKVKSYYGSKPTYYDAIKTPEGMPTIDEVIADNQRIAKLLEEGKV